MSFLRLPFSRKERKRVKNLLSEKFQEMLGLLRGEIFQESIPVMFQNNDRVSDVA